MLLCTSIPAEKRTQLGAVVLLASLPCSCRWLCPAAELSPGTARFQPSRCSRSPEQGVGGGFRPASLPPAHAG